MTFPTKADIEFFSSEKAKRIQELFPGLDSGDWIRRKRDGHIFLIVEADLEAERLALYGGYGLNLVYDETFHWHERYIFLPRQGQLQAMLGEYVRPLWLGGPFEVETNTHYKVVAGGEWFGPTPSIALGRCLLEALKEEEDDI